MIAKGGIDPLQPPPLLRLWALLLVAVVHIFQRKCKEVQLGSGTLQKAELHEYRSLVAEVWWRNRSR